MVDDLGGEDRDFGRLFVRHQARIYGYIRSLVPRRCDAEDILQETASVLWRKFSQFQPGTSFLAWSLQVARYQAMYYARKNRRNVLCLSEKMAEDLAEETIAQAVRLEGLRDALGHCLHRLSSGDRDLFEQRYHQETTTIDVAKNLGKPPTTVYNALARIRRALVECLTRFFGKEGVA